MLFAEAAAVAVRLSSAGPYADWFRVSCAISACFALLVWQVRAATAAAAAVGALICLNLLLARGRAVGWRETALPALLTLFVLTFAATRFGRARKEKLGMAEPRQGRCASQIVANLGIAGLCAAIPATMLYAACVAALAEATADTVASELGQALGGRTLMITSWREVPAGTDGGISLAGTLLGVAAAGAIAWVTALTTRLPPRAPVVIWVAGVAGLLFDSCLGATVERRGWIGNDLVNLFSTLFAAAAAAGLFRCFCRY